MRTLEKIKGDLIVVDIEVEGFNRQYGCNYDGYVLTPQTARATKSMLYGFYGIPTDVTPAYLVETYYR